ncbi:hypothetical protein DQ04_21801000, partial [Trypanosoma grayi]|uniref:hypothetical protein n=1 Tax=Trypanosoma grayi TaxID=71804 RepID=UPI0004F44ABF
RGLLRRETRWHWASATAAAGHGFHLSEGTYDVGNRSVENTLYAAGRVRLLDTAVEFQRGVGPDVAAEATWVITGDGVQLRFRRVDAHDGELHFGLVDGNLDHAWGVFEGAIEVDGATYVFDNVTGVLERHYALW